MKKIKLTLITIILTTVAFAAGTILTRFPSASVTVNGDGTVTITGDIQEVIDEPILQGDDVSSAVINAKVKALDTKINGSNEEIIWLSRRTGFASFSPTDLTNGTTSNGCE